MNRFYKKYRTVGNLINMLLVLSVLLPLLALSYFNHPSPADDYCYIDTVFKYSWWEAMNFYYSGWTGRYFGILLNHSNPLLFHSITGFKVIPVVLFMAMLFAFYNLFRHLTPTLSRAAHLGFAGVVFFLYILKMASIVEGFYWMAAFVTYTVPNILTLLWVAVVLDWYRQDTRKTLLAILANLMVFAIIGCSETNLVILVMLLGALWFYRLVFHKKVDSLMISMLIIGVLSVYIFLSAPGNSARLDGNPMSRNIGFSIISSFKQLAILSFPWIFKTPLLIFSLAWVIVLSKISVGARNYFSMPVWFAILLYIGVLAGQIFPSYYGIGIEPSLRAVNCVYLFFLIGWFYVIGVIFHYFHKRYTPNFPLSFLRYGVLYSLLVISIAFSFFRSANVKMIYSDLLRGKAAAFSRETDERYALIQNSKTRIVYLPPIKTRPMSLYFDDISTNRDHWWNKCMAGYFGKEAIIMIETK
ncbi:DUF6056 family protein [Dyadobacter sp. 3J3]|uniref:DUF6056 family protein n=1 Tax=Dyadobacter sp. 3J3 TaxID=2606600 RepID=UPI001359A07D|nr:DUF6056 family protein [Dyadobacter sp. 3J3]